MTEEEKAAKKAAAEAAKAAKETTNETIVEKKILTFGTTKFTVVGEFKDSELSDIQKNGLSESIFEDGEIIEFPNNLILSAIEFESGKLKSSKPYAGFLTTNDKPLSLGTLNTNVGKSEMLVSEKLNPATKLTNIGTDKLKQLLSGKKCKVVKQKVFVQHFDDVAKKFSTFINPINGHEYRTMKQKNLITIEIL
jgi:hypothetical protein